MLASVDDLEKLLRKTFREDEREGIELLLEAASEEVRGTIGQHVAPTVQATFRARANHEGIVMLPQHPVVAVDAVTTEAGEHVNFDWVDDHIEIGSTKTVLVTFSYGYDTVPADLRQWTLVLTAGVLRNLEMGIGPSAGGLSSLAIDDFRAAFADGGDKTGMHIPEIQAEQLRERYGVSGVTVVGMR